MEYNDDGTITFDMPSRNGGNGKEITLRPPRLAELRGLWLYVDKIADDAKPKAKPKRVSGRKVAEPEPEPEETSKVAGVVATMDQNLAWTRKVIATLGPDGLYGGDDEVGYTLADEKLDEPPWFVSGQLAARWLAHWQSVP